ncbi:serine/arginine-rich splicing factor 11-like isoform X2 [Branchiostoma floridae]|uniref:Splicing regulatory glutamine/lysine-rich protein 1 n=1 Tax=Branchiostoma floridae TaxID=7739 RepID=A0A9J7NC50_BRAFL|nr:serine/arginine-rich splicing factor 11-like isoform X2 [Branchiostoma floridae]
MTQTKVIQVTNVAPAATKEQMQTLFSFLGKIDEIKLYPEDISVPVTSKVCYVKYDDPTNCGVAQHLTNTVFIDRALIVVPCQDGIIPDEAKALQLAAPANAVAGMIPGGAAPAASALLPTPAPIANPLLAAAGVAGGEVLGATLADQDILGAFFPESVSKDVLGSGMGDQLPPLPGNVDPSKIDEIRRTVYVGNLDSATVTAEQLLNFFQQVGEVKYVRMAGDETQPTRFAFVEFADQTSVAKALQYNGIMFGNRPLKVNYSNIALNKPVALTNPHVAQIDAVLNQVREAQSHISSALNAGTMTAATLQIPAIEKPTLRSSEISEKKDDKRRRSRSRSRSYSRRRRSRSRSPRRSRSRRSRSRSRHRRSRSRSPKRRSRSPRRRRSRSRERRSRSRSRRSPSKSPARRHSATAKGRRRSRTRTPPRSYRTTSRLSRSKSSCGCPQTRDAPSERMARSPRRRSRTPKRSPSKSPARRTSSSKHKKEKKKDKDKDRDRSGSRERDTTKSKKKKKDKDKDKDREREKDKEKHRGKSKEQEEEKKEAKVTRDYDEEEQGYDSEKEKVAKAPAPEAPVEQPAEAPPSSEEFGDSGSQGQADMDVDSD